MALLDGVKYGLSSQANQSGNKTVIFVKLTDSALRAIDDYLKGQHKPGQRANLRFLGNEGTIHIPSSTSDNGHSFDFSLSTNTDVESPQGSFECIQQCGTKVLQSAGPLSYKMRIKANDDVFVQTQNRFTELEHERRQECAKEIKSNCAYIGRKVKNKINLPPIPQQRRKPSPNYISQHQQQPKYPLSAPSFANPSSNSHKLPNGFSSGSNNNRKTVNGISNGNHQSAPSSVNGPSSKPATNPPTHDVSRRPLKERLIHMLAVRPYKKPELFQRLNSDGLKDRDKKILMPILQQVSSFKDNEYSLLRGVWNDVQEDWPFYTEQEKQLMKRRKPQNLTPPGSDSSVGSGTSSLSPRSNSPVGPGHSPSTYSHTNHSHSSSYHRVASGPTDSESKGIKRPVNSGILTESVEDYGDIPNKKTRVSHFKKPGSGGNSSPGNGANSLISSRSEVITKEKDISSGSSPQFTSHNNRIAERLSPIRSSGSGSHLSVPNGGLNGATHSVSNNHRSPRNGNFESMEVSPSHGSTISNGYHNNSSAQGDAAVEESVSVGSSWQSRNGNDAHGLSDSEKVTRGDSDETDSVDSGNGSSSSSGSSGSQHNHNPSYNGSKEKDVHHGGYSNGGAAVKPEKSEFISSSVNNNINAKSSSLMNGCNRVSSTTNFHSTPQSSPDSQVDAMQLLQQQKCQLNSKDNASTAVSKQRFNGKCNFETNPEIIITRDKGCERETHRDRDRERDRSSRRNDRDRGKERERDKERSKDRGKRSGERKHSRKSDDREEHSYEIEDTDGSTVKISSEYPSYLTKYTAIANTEERGRYKDDFNAEYATYRDLHAVIDKVSKRFAHLEERLRQEERGTEGYEKIKDQIVNEYYANKRDKKYQETRQRFLYLHEKLSHIKRLVSDYDAHQQDQDLPNDYPNGFLRP